MDDYASGPSGSSADAETAFLAGILAVAARRGGPRLLLADGTGSEGSSLSEAIAGIPDLRLALLYPEGHARRAEFEASASHGKAARSSSSPSAAAAPPSTASSARRRAGSSPARASPPPVPRIPARFAARIVVLASTFSILRKGAAADLFMGIRAGDGFAFAACLWAWRLGLPIKGIVLSIGAKGVLGLDPAGRILVDRFDAERPGVIRSLALLHPVDHDRR